MKTGLFLLLMSISLHLFGNFSESEYISYFHRLSNKIISESPNLIKKQVGDKFYLNEEKIYPFQRGVYLLLDTAKEVYLPLIFFDEDGFFLSLNTKEYFAKKLFKFICNLCKYEWEGGVFTIRCPNCRSKDISNVFNS